MDICDENLSSFDKARVIRLHQSLMTSYGFIEETGTGYKTIQKTWIIERTYKIFKKVSLCNICQE